MIGEAIPSISTSGSKAEEESWPPYIMGKSRLVSFKALCMAGLTFATLHYASPVLRPHLQFIRSELAVSAVIVCLSYLVAAAIELGLLRPLYSSTPPGNAKSGYGKVRVFPHRDWLFGTDFLFESLEALKQNRLLDLTTDRFRRLGSTYYCVALGSWLCMTDEPENIKAVLSTKFDDWPIAGPRLLAVLPVVGKKSVFSSNNHDWQHARAMIRPTFVRDQVADLKCFDRHISHLIAHIPKDGSVVDLQRLVQAMTMDSSTDFMLGYSTNTLVTPSPEAQQFIADFEYASRESAKKARLGTLLFLLPNRELDTTVKRMRKYVLSYLGKAVKEKGEKERSYVFLDEILDSGESEGYIIDQILSVIVAGRDTTATALTACFWVCGRTRIVSILLGVLMQ